MEFQDCINYLLTTAQHEVFGIFSGRLAVHGLTPTQYAVLKCLWDSEEPVPEGHRSSLWSVDVHHLGGSGPVLKKG